jgi:hypothetical protein
VRPAEEEDVGVTVRARLQPRWDELRRQYPSAVVSGMGEAVKIVVEKGDLLVLNTGTSMSHHIALQADCLCNTGEACQQRCSAHSAAAEADRRRNVGACLSAQIGGRIARSCHAPSQSEMAPPS